MPCQFLQSIVHAWSRTPGRWSSAEWKQRLFAFDEFYVRAHIDVSSLIHSIYCILCYGVYITFTPLGIGALQAQSIMTCLQLPIPDTLHSCTAALLQTTQVETLFVSQAMQHALVIGGTIVKPANQAAPNIDTQTCAMRVAL